MQNVPWYMDLVGAGFTNHGSNQGGILIETESGGHVELVNADPAHTTMAAMPDRFFTVEEVYNTNRNPAELGIVHPLMYENEDSLDRPARLRHRRAAQQRPARDDVVPQLRRRPLLHHRRSATTGSSRPRRGGRR